MSIMVMSLFSQVNTGFNPNFKMPSLFNPNKMKMTHSMSFMSGVSSNKQGFYQSTYTNHINMQLNPKLTLKMDMSFVNYGTATYNKGLDIKGNKDNRNAVIPSFSLQYKPSDTTSITFEFSQYTGGSNYWADDTVNKRIDRFNSLGHWK